MSSKNLNAKEQESKTSDIVVKKHSNHRLKIKWIFRAFLTFLIRLKKFRSKTETYFTNLLQIKNATGMQNKLLVKTEN